MPFGVITLLRRDTNIIMLTHEGQISCHSRRSNFKVLTHEGQNSGRSIHEGQNSL